MEMTLNSLIRNESLAPEAVFHSQVPSNSSKVSQCTSPFVSVTSHFISPDLGGLFVSLATRTQRGARSFL